MISRPEEMLVRLERRDETRRDETRREEQSREEVEVAYRDEAKIDRR
jgi:hypothetical protein